jgi:hypothetical protein
VARNDLLEGRQAARARLIAVLQRVDDGHPLPGEPLLAFAATASRISSQALSSWRKWNCAMPRWKCPKAVQWASSGFRR